MDEANKFNKRIFRIFRNALKYGDCFFVRDPETQKWLYIDNAKVDRIVVNESEGKKPEQYVIRDINPNLQRLSATQITPNQTYGGTGGGGAGAGIGGQAYWPSKVHKVLCQDMLAETQVEDSTRQ